MNTTVVLNGLKTSRGLTNSQIGEAAGVSADAVQKWISGRNAITADSIELLCKAFGIAPSDFFEPAEPAEPAVSVPMATRWDLMDADAVAAKIAGMTAADSDVALLETTMLKALILSAGYWSARNEGMYESREYSTYNGMLCMCQRIARPQSFRMSGLFENSHQHSEGAFLAGLVDGMDKDRVKLAALKAANDIIKATGGHLWMGGSRFVCIRTGGYGDGSHVLFIKNKYSDPDGATGRYAAEYDEEELWRFLDGFWIGKDLPRCEDDYRKPGFDPLRANPDFVLDREGLYRAVSDIIGRAVNTGAGDAAVKEDVLSPANVDELAYALLNPFDPQVTWDRLEILGKRYYGILDAWEDVPDYDLLL